MVWVFPGKVVDGAVVVLKVGLKDGIPGPGGNAVNLVGIASVGADRLTSWSDFVADQRCKRTHGLGVDNSPNSSWPFLRVCEIPFGGLRFEVPLFVSGSDVEAIVFVDVAQEGGEVDSVVVIVVGKVGAECAFEFVVTVCL